MGNVSASLSSASKTLQPLVSQLRNPKEVIKGYEFYKKTFNQQLEPLASSHFTTEVYAKGGKTSVFHDIDVENLKAEVDHRRSGCMTSIDDQGACGSCWAMATISGVESARKLKTGILEKLSAQELIDCVEGCSGCKGGSSRVALDYIQRRGVSLYEDYPLHPLRIQGECSVKSSNRKIYISGYRELPFGPGAETILKHAVKQQPVIAVIFIGAEFAKYKAGDGIFKTDCTDGRAAGLERAAGHVVLVIGYGECEGHKFWLIRNSFGIRWGYKGYGLIKRDHSHVGMCGIAMCCFYPVCEEEQADASQDNNSDIVAKTPPPKSGVISPSTSVLPGSTV